MRKNFHSKPFQALSNISIKTAVSAFNFTQKKTPKTTQTPHLTNLPQPTAANHQEAFSAQMPKRC